LVGAGEVVVTGVAITVSLGTDDGSVVVGGVVGPVVLVVCVDEEGTPVDVAGDLAGGGVERATTPFPTSITLGSGDDDPEDLAMSTATAAAIAIELPPIHSIHHGLVPRADDDRPRVTRVMSRSCHEASRVRDGFQRQRVHGTGPHGSPSLGKVAVRDNRRGIDHGVAPVIKADPTRESQRAHPMPIA